MTIRSGMCAIMRVIRTQRLELSDPEFGNNTLFHVVYTLVSTNINQSTANFVKMYLCQNEILDEFDYVCNPTRMTGIICP